MIFLDTNVVSEVMRPIPFAAVLAWLARNDGELALSAVVIAEISFGIERLRPAERAARLARSFGDIRQHYSTRIFPLDEAAALIYGAIMGEASRQSRPLSPPDAMIAAIALRHNAALATRNTAHFRFEGLRIVNPWE